MNVKGADRLGAVTTYYFANKLAEIAQMNQERTIPIINLGIGSPDLLPPSEVVDELRSRSLDISANKYQSYRGIPELRSAFSDWYGRHFDVALEAGTQILPLAGSKEGVMHIHMSMLNPGDQVLVPDPGYPAYRMTAALAGAETVFYDLKAERHWLPDLDALAETDVSKVKIMWINYPHMPTGAKADLTFYHRLIDFAREHDILICHDNPYVFILNDDPISIMQVPGAMDHAVELVSLSKCYNMAGWRVGAMIGRSDVIDMVLKFKSNMDSGMYQPVQYAAAKALATSPVWSADINDIYRRRRVMARRIMDAIGATYEAESAGMFVWARIPDNGQSAEAYCDEILYGCGVFITPGHIFGKNGEGYVRISLCSDEPTLALALKNITSHLKSKTP